jgi:hypothetical protein
MKPSIFIAGAFLALAPFAAPGALAGPAKQDTPKLAVIELFTSQGCSSCPPADALLAQLGKRPELVTLSYSVDYWNYLGWQDTLSSAANSERQRDYARMRGDGQVYTPQVVVDGVMHVNGGNEAAIEMAIRNAADRSAAMKVPVSMYAQDNTLVIGIGAAPETSEQREATVWLAVAKAKETVAIGRGENRGKTITYSHPVRELAPVGMWKGEAMTLRLPLKDLRTSPGDCLVALLQIENGGPILGAAQYDRP